MKQQLENRNSKKNVLESLEHVRCDLTLATGTGKRRAASVGPLGQPKDADLGQIVSEASYDEISNDDSDYSFNGGECSYSDCSGHNDSATRRFHDENWYRTQLHDEMDKKFETAFKKRGKWFTADMFNDIDIRRRFENSRGRVSEILKSDEMVKQLSMIRDDLKSLFKFVSHGVEGSVDLLIQLIYGIYRLVKYENRMDLIFSLTNLVSILFQGSIEAMFTEIVDLLNSLLLVISEFFKQNQSESEFDDFKPREPEWSYFRVPLLDVFNMVVESHIFKSFQKLLLGLVGLRFFDKSVAQKFTKFLGVPEKMTLLDFSRNMASTLEDFINFGLNIARGQSFYEAATRNDVELRFVDKTNLIVKQSNSIFYGEARNFPKLVEEGMIPAEEYQRDLINHVTQGLSIKRDLEIAGKKLNLLFVNRLYQLREIATLVKTTLDSKRRFAPIGVIIHGDPGIGKANLLVHVNKLYCMYRKYDYSDSLIYHRNTLDDYWTNHNPAIQPIIHFPELGSLSSNIAKSMGDPALAEMLMVSDTQPYSANQAALEDKGKCHLRPEMVIIDCNQPDMNIHLTLNNPAAIRRRFVYIHPVVKVEYRKTDSMALDPSKIPLDKEFKNDLFDFTIYREDPKDIKNSTKVYLHLDKTSTSSITMNIFDLSKTLIEVFKKHDDDQQRSREAAEEDIAKYLEPQSESDFTEIIEEINSYSPVNLSVFMLLGIIFFFPFSSLILFSSYLSFLMYPTVCFKYVCKILSFFDMMRHAKPFQRRGYSMNVAVLYYIVYWKATLWDLFYRFQEIFSVPHKLLHEFFVLVLPSNFLTSKILNWTKPTDTLKKSLLFFLFSLSLYKLLHSLFKLFRTTCQSEGNIVSSSGKFTPSNVQEILHGIETQTGCAFPLPQKKNNTTKDYDAVENFYPRLVADPVTTNDPNEIMNRINRNRRNLIIHSMDGTTRDGKGLGIKGSYLLMNRHNFIPNTVIFFSKGTKSEQEMVVNTNNAEFHQIGEDMVLVRTPAHCYLNITRYFADFPNFTTELDGIFEHEPVKVRLSLEHRPFTNTSGDYLITRSLMYRSDKRSVGTCGAPIVIKWNNNLVLAGIHTGSTLDNIFNRVRYCISTTISRSQIEEGLKKFGLSKILETMSEGSVKLAKFSKLSNTSPRSPLLYENIPGLAVAGFMTGYKFATPKSTLQDSPIINDLDNLLGISMRNEQGKRKYAPPMMKSALVNGEYIAPYNNWVKKLGVVKRSLNQHVMNFLIENYSTHLYNSMKSKKKNFSLSPYPLSVAQNGYPLNFYVRAVNNNTSAGALFPGSKSLYNVNIEYPFKKDSVDPIFDIKEQLLEIIDSYKNEELSHNLVGAQLKDEPREISKVLAGKTRVFAMSSYEMSLVNRMYLMPFYSLMCEQRDIFSTKVGINMHSVEADEMYRALSDFSPYIMEGDYGGYDTSMPVDIGLMANSVVYEFLKMSGYNKEALCITKGILSDNLFPTIMFEGNVVQAPGFQASGKYATAEDNSLRGVILLQYAYLMMCTPCGDGHVLNRSTNFGLTDFFKYLLPITYGDDMLCGVKPELSSFFNNITYGEFVARIYGMEFTSASKNQHSAQFTPITDISFLKRTFKMHPYMKRYVAILDKESLLKSLMYVLPSKVVSVDVQVVETMSSVLRELFFHYDTIAEYDDMRKAFIDLGALRLNKSRKDLEQFFPKGIDLYAQYFN